MSVVAVMVNTNVGNQMVLFSLKENDSLEEMVNDFCYMHSMDLESYRVEAMYDAEEIYGGM